MCTELFFFFKCYDHHRDLHSFPTRRSSDLGQRHADRGARGRHRPRRLPGTGVVTSALLAVRGLRAAYGRSEEHTSELQSPCNIVCRLLLEKKNQTVVWKNRESMLGMWNRSR